MTSNEVHIAYYGLAENDIQVVRSLINIVSGRHRIVWKFSDRPPEQADVLMIYSEAPGAEKLSVARKKNKNLFTILARPPGTFPPSADNALRVVHYPLRANELLDILDLIERSVVTQIEQQKPAKPGAHAGAPPPHQQKIAAPTETADEFVSAFAATDLSKARSLDWNASQEQLKPPSLLVPSPEKSKRNKEAIDWEAPKPHEIWMSDPVVEKPARPSADSVHSSLDIMTYAPSSILSIKPASEPASAPPDPPPVAKPTTVAQLKKALRSIRQTNAKQKYVDIYTDKSGWIGRVEAGKDKILASSQFMNRDRHLPQNNRHYFYCNVVKQNRRPLLYGNDTLIMVEHEMFFWQLAFQYCHSLPRLSLPYGTLRMLRWPDFTILPEFAARQGVALAMALLSRNALPLKTLLEESRASEGDLACLIAACWLSGCLTLVPPPPKPVAEDTRDNTLNDTNNSVVKTIKKVLGMKA